jgi:hypothetical protein
LNKINENSIFGLTLGSSLGLIFFTKIDSRSRANIINKNNWISWGIGQTCATLLQEQKESIQYEIWGMAETNQSFRDGLSYGISIAFTSLSDEFKILLWPKIKENRSLSDNVQFYLAENFSNMDNRFKEEILSHIDSNGLFGSVLISRLGYLYTSLDRETKEKIWHYVYTNDGLQYSFGFSIAHNFVNTKFKDLENDLQEKVLSFRTKSHYFAIGLNEGIAHYSSQNGEKQK